AGPALELGAGPLEAVVPVTERSRRKALEPHVVFRVRRGQDDGPGTSVAEQGSLERFESRGVEVLDHLDHGGRVEALQPAVPVGERALDEVDALTLLRGHLLEVEAPSRSLERRVRDVDADDPL